MMVEPVYHGIEEEKQFELRRLFEEWRGQLVSEWHVDRSKIDSAFIEDGFYPLYFSQNPRILFIGREGRGLGECYTYTGCLYSWYKEGVLNGQILEKSRFHSLICYLAYGFKKYWANGAFPKWQEIPWSSDIGKTVGTADGLSFAFMNLSKISNDSDDFKTDYSTMSRFVDASAKMDFIGREIDILDPTLIVTMNFSQYFHDVGIEIIKERPIVFDENHDVCFQFAKIRGRIRPILDMWHFSAWTKDMNDNYYNPLVSIAERVDMRSQCEEVAK